jgi:hypothetical protein
MSHFGREGTPYSSETATGLELREGGREFLLLYPARPSSIILPSPYLPAATMSFRAHPRTLRPHIFQPHLPFHIFLPSCILTFDPIRSTVRLAVIGILSLPNTPIRPFLSRVSSRRRSLSSTVYRIPPQSCCRRGALMARFRWRTLPKRFLRRHLPPVYCTRPHAPNCFTFRLGGQR